MKMLKGLLVGLNILSVTVAIANGVRAFISGAKEDANGDAKQKAAYYEGFIDGHFNKTEKNPKEKKKRFRFSKKGA